MVEITKLQKAAREFYQLISPYEMDIRDEGITEGLKEGHERGFKEGRAEGIQQGSHARNIEIAKQMLQNNMSKSDVHMYTSLSLEEIEALQKN